MTVNKEQVKDGGFHMNVFPQTKQTHNPKPRRQSQSSMKATIASHDLHGKIHKNQDQHLDKIHETTPSSNSNHTIYNLTILKKYIER